MNICFCSQEYPPDTHVGGIGTYTYNMAGALAALGHNVHVITSTPWEDRDYSENQVTVHRIRYRSFRPLELSRLNYAHRVASRLKQTGCTFDIIQASEYASEGFWLSLFGKTPFVTRLATPSFLIEKLNGKSFASRRLFCDVMEKQQTLRSAAIYASTKALAAAVAEGWGIEKHRIDVFPNSVYISRIVTLGRNGALPENLRGVAYMLYFGRLEERKGVRVLADALPSIFERFPDIHMLFVGSDLGYRGAPMQDYVRSKAGRYSVRLRFLDNLPHAKLLPIVNEAKLVILPSLWEAFGFVCVEAMALGRPVIASSGSGFEEIINDNVSGYLVEPGDWRALADKIQHALRDETGRTSIALAAEKRAQDFEVSRIAGRLADYFEQIRGRCSRQGRSAEAGFVS
ncbi:MAG: putative Phosphatidylethanolamine N-methyltransferase [Acidobacteria bacterium]|nr:putative Phosphatidylethanolamine N-methyltransferase [Acidobacteriota bacterium]